MSNSTTKKVILIDKDKNKITPFVAFSGSVVADTSVIDDYDSTTDASYGFEMMKREIDDVSMGSGQKILVTTDTSIGCISIGFNESSGNTSKILNERGEFITLNPNDFDVSDGSVSVKGNVAYDSSITSATKYYLVGKDGLTDPSGTLSKVWVGCKNSSTGPYIYFDGDCNLYQTSDETSKDILGDFSISLNDVNAIRKILYKFKGSDKVSVGITAQSLKKVCPELVDVDQDGKLSVSYDKLSVLALSAIDSLCDVVKSLEHRISALEK